MMSLLLLLLPFRNWIAGAALAAVLAASAFAAGHHRGEAAAEARWQAAAAAEATRQAAARARALDQAVSRELARTAENNALEQQVTDYETRLAQATETAEPAAMRPARDPHHSGNPPLCHRLSAADVGELRKLQGDGPP